MIGFLRGRVVIRDVKSILFDVNGVGYEIFMPFSELAHFLPSDKEVILYTHLIWREDLINLYGFGAALSRDIFRILLDVSGVGAKVSLNILSHIRANELLLVISKGETRKLEEISGVGKKTAAKICIDLKEKAKALLSRDSNMLTNSDFNVAEKLSSVEEDALSALINLGYRSNEARVAIEKTVSLKNDANVEEIIRLSLQLLAKSS
jgi:Holliday junction DNA helicase RuvA